MSNDNHMTNVSYTYINEMTHLKMWVTLVYMKLYINKCEAMFINVGSIYTHETTFTMWGYIYKCETTFTNVGLQL